MPHPPPTATTPLILLGGGGHAAVVAESARRAGYTILGFVDNPGSSSANPHDLAAINLKRLGDIETLPQLLAQLPSDTALHPAVGNNTLRAAWLTQFDTLASWPSIIDPTAIVTPSASIGAASFIGPRAVVNARATIGRAVIVNTAAVIEHDAVISDCCHIAPASVIAGSVRIGPRTLIGLNATVLPLQTIGCDVRIGAGAVVTTTIPDHATAVGIPARITNRAQLTSPSTPIPR